MKRIFIFILLFCNIILLQAQRTNAILKESIELFNERKYNEVIFLLKKNEKEIKKDPENHAYFLMMLGMVKSELGQYSEAEQSYLKAKKIFGKDLENKHSFYVTNLNFLAELYNKIEYSSKEEECYLEILTIQEKVSGKEHPDYVTTLNDLGNLYFSMTDYAKTEKCYLEVLTTITKVWGKENSGYHSILNSLLLLYQKMEDYIQIEKYSLEILAIKEKKLGKESFDYAMSSNDLGILYLNMGDYPKAEKIFLEVLAILEKNVGKEHSDYASTLNNLGVLYKNMGNYAHAEKKHLEALAIKEIVFGKEHPDCATSLANLGMLYNDIGDYDKAEKYLLEAKAIDENNLGKTHPDYATTLNNLGLLYDNIGDYLTAKKNYLESLSIREKILGKTHPDYATSLGNLGSLYCKTGDYLQAERVLLEALIIRENVWGKDHPDYTNSLNNLGLLYYTMGDYIQTEKYYLEAISINGKILGKDHPVYAISLISLGFLYYHKEDYLQAEKFFLEALTIRERVFGKEHPDYPTFSNNLSCTYLKTNKISNAISLKTESDRIITSQVKNNFSFLSERQRSLFWDKNRRNIEATYSFAFAYPVDSITRHAYNNVLFIKNLLLSTSNEIRDVILSSGNKELINQYEKLRILRQQIDALQTKTDNYNKEYIASLETKADSLDKVITIASSAYRAMKADLEIDWNTVCNHLSEQEAAIEFIDFHQFTTSWTDTTRYAALLIRKGWTAPKLIPLFEQKQLEEFTRVGSSELYSGYVGKQISKLIWQPLQKYLNDGDNVYFSPSGVLHQLAIESLPLEDGRLASEKYNLYRLSSTKQLCYERPEKKYNKAVLYGGLKYDLEDEVMVAQSRAYTENRDHYSMRGFESDTAYRGSWGYLSGSKKEIENISSTLINKGVKTLVFKENKGNEESFRSLSGGRNDIIHIATHGFFLPLEKARKKEYFGMLGDHTPVVDNSMRRSGLIMSGGNRAWEGQPIPEDVEDGVLTSQEIMSLDLRGADLVVLSACETGLGEVSGEGVFGLQRAFKKAGAQTLIMTLWKVSDEATQFMMSKFYSHLLSGNSKREAFLKAQVATKAKYTNPYYWAGFIMLD